MRSAQHRVPHRAGAWPAHILLIITPLAGVFLYCNTPPSPTHLAIHALVILIIFHALLSSLRIAISHTIIHSLIGGAILAQRLAQSSGVRSRAGDRRAMAGTRSRSQGGAALLAVLKEHVTTADELDYTTDLDGDVDGDTITAWKDMMLAAREAMYPQTSISQKCGKAVFVDVLEANGASWNLGAEEASWADTSSKMFRAMLRHVQQAVIKMKNRRTSA
eukprot:5632512-Pyramimonas_sp.AAC.1